MPASQPTKTIKVDNLFRAITLSREAVNSDERTIELSCASENPVERWWYQEILDMSSGSVRLDRMKQSGPLLMDHNTRDQIGVIESCVVKDKRLVATVRFGKSARAEEIFQDVIDGIRANISIGYCVYRYRQEQQEEYDKNGNTIKPAIYRAIDWEPHEISFVSVPADTSVGVNRSRESGKNEVIVELPNKEERDMKCPKCGAETNGGACTCGHREAAPQSSAPGNITVGREEGVKAERHRVSEINAIADKYPQLREAAGSFIRDGKTLDEFRQHALESVHNPTPVSGTADLGLSDKEKRSYSLVKAIRSFLAPGEATKWDGLEREASEATAKLCKRDAKGFFIPQDILSTPFSRSMQMMQRTMTTGSFSGGGALIDSELRTADMIELLRNKALVSQMGARTLSGLVGNIAIPRVTGGATAYWLPESGTVNASDQSFGQLGLVPHRLVGDTGYSKELLMQSSVDVEGFVREDLMRVLALEKDRVAITGLGAAGEPRGIMNTTGVGSVTFGAAPTWAKVVDFETQVADANADTNTMAYLTTPKVKGAWKTAPKVAGQAIFLWNGGEVNGYPAFATKQVPGEKVIFGNWNDLIIAEWAGIDVVVDPYSLKKQGLIEITVTMWTDSGVRHAASFAISADAGNQ